MSGYVVLGLTGVIVVCTALLALIAETKPESGLLWMITLVFVLMAAALHRMTFHPMVKIERDGVRVRNPLSEHLLEWHDIAGVKPGYWGLAFELRSRKPVCAFALQKSNYAAARGLDETISDVAARTIMQRATGDPTHPGVALPSDDERKASAKKARIIIAIGLTLFVIKNVLDFL